MEEIEAQVGQVRVVTSDCVFTQTPDSDFKAHDVVSITPYIFDLGTQCLFTQL